MNKILKEPERTCPAACGATDKRPDEKQRSDYEQRCPGHHVPEFVLISVNGCRVEPAASAEDYLGRAHWAREKRSGATVAVECRNADPFQRPVINLSGKETLEMGIRQDCRGKLRKLSLNHPIPMHCRQTWVAFSRMRAVSPPQIPRATMTSPAANSANDNRERENFVKSTVDDF